MNEPPPLFNMLVLPFSRKVALMLHEVHEVLREVFHRLGGCIGADMPGRAIGANRATTVVRAIKGLSELPVGH